MMTSKADTTPPSHDEAVRFCVGENSRDCIDAPTSESKADEEYDDNVRERESVSLAMACDVTQAPSKGAVAQHLKSMLSHLSSNEHVVALKSELNTDSKSASPVVAESPDKLRTQSTAQVLDHNEEQSSSPPPHNDKFFKRMVHAIDNFLNPPSQLLSHVHLPHHHQGHRLDSNMQSTRHDNGTSSQHACTSSCLPNCQILLHQNEQQQRKHTRRIPTFASSIASSIHKHTHHNNSKTQTKHHSPKSFFPFSLHHSGHSTTQSTNANYKKSYSGPLLYGTSDHDEHEAIITTALHVCNLYHAGEDVNRTVHVHRPDFSEIDHDLGSTSERSKLSESSGERFDQRAKHALLSLDFEFRLELCEKCQGEKASEEEKKANGDESTSNRCFDCLTRLYHVASDAAITGENRRTYIADGKMYDAVANLCQAAAQEIMAETCDLVWVTICDGKGGGLHASQQQKQPQSSVSMEEWPRDDNGDIIIQEPIRALVSRQHSNVDTTEQDTFLISTGKGKVRAGVFSRHHLLTTGLEPATALPIIYEARNRGMNCVVIDPNARGDRVGMDTFEASIRGLFEQQHSVPQFSENDDTTTTRPILPASNDGSIYVLAHSAAGGQLVRYLLDQQKDAPLLSRIRGIAFSDSTHSIQWLKQHPHISSLIQSSNALYVRSANKMRDDDWEKIVAGDECPKDHFWSHRFGEIRTVWAGTTEHSLSNWTAHKPIWDFFDGLRRK